MTNYSAIGTAKTYRAFGRDAVLRRARAKHTHRRLQHGNGQARLGSKAGSISHGGNIAPWG